MLIESIAIGLVYAFFFYERIGFSPGGLVVPGYIALYWDRPWMIVSTFAISLAVYGMTRLLSQLAILYGKRRFILVVLIGFLFQWLFRLLIVRTQFTVIEIDPIGYIIPGLIANEMERQSILPTALSLVIVSVLVRLTLVVLGFLRPW